MTLIRNPDRERSSNTRDNPETGLVPEVRKKKREKKRPKFRRVRGVRGEDAKLRDTEGDARLNNQPLSVLHLRAQCDWPSDAISGAPGVYPFEQKS